MAYLHRKTDVFCACGRRANFELRSKDHAKVGDYCLRCGEREKRVLHQHEVAQDFALQVQRKEGQG